MILSISSRPNARIAVLGAGLQGSCVALALAARGHRVMLLEQRAAPLQAAALRNEGKIHLGFVYAFDVSGLTRRRMLEGALSFAPLLDGWCGPQPWNAWRSDGFRYAIMPDSLADADRLEAAYEDVWAKLPEVIASCRVRPHYLGRDLTWLWRWSRAARGRPLVAGCPVSQMAETEEISVDPRRLARAVANTIAADPRIAPCSRGRGPKQARTSALQRRGAQVDSSHPLRRGFGLTFPTRSGRIGTRWEGRSCALCQGKRLGRRGP